MATQESQQSRAALVNDPYHKKLNISWTITYAELSLTHSLPLPMRVSNQSVVKD